MNSLIDLGLRTNGSGFRGRCLTCETHGPDPRVWVDRDSARRWLREHLDSHNRMTPSPERTFVISRLGNGARR